MAAVTTAVAAVAAVAIAAGGTAYQISESKKQQKEAKKEMERQRARQNELDDEAKRRLENEESEERGIATRNAARNRQRALAAGAQGRRDTILTSPLGVQGEAAPTAGKTLLGQ